MASLIKSVTFDCSDAVALATFWAAALGTDVDEDATSDRAYVEAPGWGGPNMWFIRVPEPKAAKNRMHFDLRAPVTMADEVSRLQFHRRDRGRAVRRPYRHGGPRGQRLLRGAGPGRLVAPHGYRPAGPAGSRWLAVRRVVSKSWRR